jgi:hypothetical protein
MTRRLTAETLHWEDPIVAEVRRVREKLFAAAGYDLEEYGRRLRAQQQRQGRAAAARPPRTPDHREVNTSRTRAITRTPPTARRKRRG